jgi:hypothetical protein
MEKVNVSFHATWPHWTAFKCMISMGPISLKYVLFHVYTRHEKVLRLWNQNYIFWALLNTKTDLCVLHFTEYKKFFFCLFVFAACLSVRMCALLTPEHISFTFSIRAYLPYVCAHISTFRPNLSCGRPVTERIRFHSVTFFAVLFFYHGARIA